MKNIFLRSRVLPILSFTLCLSSMCAFTSMAHDTHTVATDTNHHEMTLQKTAESVVQEHTHSPPHTEATLNSTALSSGTAQPEPPKAMEHSAMLIKDDLEHQGHMNHDSKPEHSATHNMDMMEGDAQPTEGAHSAEAHAQMVQATPEELIASVGLDDKTGQKVALDTLFLDEDGNEVQMQEMIQGPTIILPIFFYCPVVCPLLISSLAEGVTEIPYKAGEEYKIIAVSFNDAETPEIAKNAKKNYLHLLPESFDKSAWSFLTGSEENILKFTNSIGFRFKKTGPNTFVHPNGLTVVDENGTIIRYIYGSTFLGADMGMAIAEAQNNAPSTSIKRLISICFNYDSEGKEYIALTFKIVATLTVLGLGLFFIIFLRRSNTSPRGPKHQIDNKPASQDEKKS